ncbi:uncharacterized protein PHALS_08378 [Plasmopara halstedii]|uniref:Uncharacterized protein n=1 Tax=Plasmopara halstedii TaxID=4781 RepID=A0A0P1AD69_PLAHL|nr:uncharacterized protein PHALS_08378 [Plasmopara halstedii]CEG38296.1 hypothetical protein PHALS_08378 [Plasmopara halstedii]|eukprot:XP_024574665.1 hypothetical protein PHALS_08378 [Plasmopara halstedii]
MNPPVIGPGIGVQWATRKAAHKPGFMDKSIARMVAKYYMTQTSWKGSQIT